MTALNDTGTFGALPPEKKASADGSADNFSWPAVPSAAGVTQARVPEVPDFYDDPKMTNRDSFGR